MTLQTIPAAAYHADPCPTPSLNNTVAQLLIDRSPAHARLAHPRLNPNYKPDSDTRGELGTAAHDLLLEGGTAKLCVIKPEDYRSKPTKAEPEGSIPKGWTNNAIRTARDTARSNGLVPILPWDEANIKRMVETAQGFIAKSEHPQLLKVGASEQTITWEEDGFWFRARLDRLSGSTLMDYKTCTDAEPEAFGRHMQAMGYDFQLCFYLRGLKAVTGQDFKALILAQEIEAPFLCSMHGMSNAMREIAEFKVQKAIDLWKQCLTSNEWPGYDVRTHYQEPAAWKLAQHERMMLSGDVDPWE